MNYIWGDGLFSEEDMITDRFDFQEENIVYQTEKWEPDLLDENKSRGLWTKSEAKEIFIGNNAGESADVDTDSAQSKAAGDIKAVEDDKTQEDDLITSTPLASCKFVRQTEGK